MQKLLSGKRGLYRSESNELLRGTVGLLKNPTHVTLNEVKGLLTLVESSSRRFFAALRMTRGGLLQQPHCPLFSGTRPRAVEKQAIETKRAGKSLPAVLLSGLT
jgi:hypothetical protein